MHKNYIVGLSSLALLSGMYVACGAHAIEANACLEMYCPRGCDLNYRNTGSPRCCRENEQLGPDEHCACVYESCEDKCCKENEVCRADKTCGPCITTKDCKGNDVCRTDGTCGGCSIHKDCAGNEYCDTTDAICKICPSGNGWSSTQDGSGNSTNTDGCKCVAPQTLWTGNKCELKGCLLGDTQYAPGNLVGDCGVCTEAGTIIENTNVTFDKDCQKCSQSTNWIIENIPDGTPVIDACKICKNGKVAYIDTNKTLSCGTGPGALCCEKNQTCEEGVCKELQVWFEDASCEDPLTPFRTSDGQCVQCIKDKHCSGNTEAKFCDESTHTCVQCTKDRHCGTFYDYDDERGCRNNVCVFTPCNIGSCQTCSVTKIDWDNQNKRWKPTVQHSFKPNGSNCIQSGITGTCNSQGNCIPKGTYCKSIGGCPTGQFCHFYSGGFSNTLPFICEKVQAVSYTITDEEGKSTTYYYPQRDDLRSWCRGADNKPGNCAWGYLSYNGAESWCYGIGKRLLTSAEFKEIITASDHLLQLEMLEVFLKEYSDLDEMKTFIQKTQKEIETLEDNETNLDGLTQKNNLLNELTSDCETLSCLDSKLTEVLSFIKGYTNFESLQKHIKVLKRYIQLHRNISKPQRWNGTSYTASDGFNTSIWVKGGVYNTSGNGTPYSSRNDGYWGAGSVICK